MQNVMCIARQARARNHFVQRCRERHGIELSENDCKLLIKDIRFGYKSENIKTLFVRALDIFIKLYKVDIKNTSMYVLYSFDLKEIITSLDNNPKEIRNYESGTSVF